ncbi:MAG TPA: maltose alpha-D-glucosyltransferase [Burkholderiales bacterium]|nr:maltose alpha-D-glucosyltransferase [Burkholderiales bacterium]
MNVRQDEEQLLENAAADAPARQEDPLWYKDAIIYQLHVKAFSDSNGDGIGDFQGLTDKLDYIKDLGVNTIWLLPFYPSPLRDDGYDIADYHGIHPDYGTRADFRHFVREAHRRDLRIVIELVINHTSDAHPWFQAARQAPPGSRKRDYYVWSDTDQKWLETRIIFTDTEKSNWTWDPVAKAYYWHRFFSHQPDLNFNNPHVVQTVIKVMRYWFDLGVDGMRLDAIPYLCERDGTTNENLPETHAVLKTMRTALDKLYPDRFFLAEANQWPEDVAEYFGAGDECHMAFHFPLMPRIYMAIAQEDRHPVVDIMQQTPDIPEACQWAIFLRNHDELTLEMVTSRERDYMYQMYAIDARARINLGIRRRLAPLMQNDPDRIKLMNSLLLSMPGSPIIYYGDEIGMGDNIYLGDRNGVRTPMQWSPDRNAGFSKSDPQRLYLPPIMDSIYGYEAVNVEAQTRDLSSMLNWMKRILAVRQSTSAFGRGRITFLRAGNRKILAYVREYGDDAVLCVANLARSAQPVELDLARFKGRVPVEMLGRAAFPPVGELPYMLTLPAYGFYWFRLAADVEVPHWHEERLVRDDLPVLVLFDGWNSLFRDRVVPWRIAMAERTRAQLERDVLPGYIASQRWYAAKGEALKEVRLSDHILWSVGAQTWMVALLDAAAPGQPQPATYFVPFALVWEDTDDERKRLLAPATIARVRQQAQVGVLAEASADDAFCRALVGAIGAGKEVTTARGKLHFRPTEAFSRIAGDDVIGTLPIRRPQAQSSNSVVTLGSHLFLKVYRQLRPGTNVELEVGRHLTEVARFPHCVPVAGSLEYTSADGVSLTLAMLQAYVENQGDGWTFSVGYLERYLEQQRTASERAPANPHDAYLAIIRTLGLRTAGLHLALAASSGNPAFEPEPVTAQDIAAWKKRAREEAVKTLTLLEQGRESLPAPAREEAQALLAQRERVLARIDALEPPRETAMKIRCHGDYHLAQVLIAENDFRIIDFEGEPSRPTEERRQKQSPLRDVAGMLRSFSYARWTALSNASHAPDDHARLAPLAAAWEAEVRRAFIESYDAAVTVPGGVPLYSSLAVMRPLIGFFELEKALYELRYELSSRPAWARVPIQGIQALLGAPSPG